MSRHCRLFITIKRRLEAPSSQVWDSHDGQMQLLDIPVCKYHTPRGKNRGQKKEEEMDKQFSQSLYFCSKNDPDFALWVSACGMWMWTENIAGYIYPWWSNMGYWLCRVPSLIKHRHCGCCGTCEHSCIYIKAPQLTIKGDREVCGLSCLEWSSRWGCRVKIFCWGSMG